MSDYISRQAAIEHAKMAAATARQQKELSIPNIVNHYFKPLASADVVEVVRCKDCKHRIFDKSRDLYYCNMYYGMGDVSDGNYCSFGERADK